MSEIPDDIIWYRGKRHDYEELAERIEKILTEILNIEKINYAVIQSRAKSMESFQTKLRDIDYSGKDLVDLAGIRAVGYVKGDKEKIIQIIRNNFDVDEAKSKDKASLLSTDRFGYRAMHLICKLPLTRTVLPEYRKFKDMIFEIQVKTILEHAWAQIEHDRNYKYKALPREIQRDFYMIAGSLEMSDDKFDQISKRIEEYDKEIKQKTDEGKLKEIDINPATLKHYLVDKFLDHIKFLPSYGDDGTGEGIVAELSSMGIKNLSDLDRNIPSHFIEAENIFLRDFDPFRESYFHSNLDSIVFGILMMKFGDKFYEVVRKSRKLNLNSFNTYLGLYQKAIASIKNT